LIDLDEMFACFKGTAEKLSLMDMSAVILVKPVHILSFLKAEYVPL
jgi:hypothetical protein